MLALWNAFTYLITCCPVSQQLKKMQSFKHKLFKTNQFMITCSIIFTLRILLITHVCISDCNVLNCSGYRCGSCPWVHILSTQTHVVPQQDFRVQEFFEDDVSDADKVEHSWAVTQTISPNQHAVRKQEFSTEVITRAYSTLNSL